METKGFLQFEIIINVSYGHYIYIYFFSAVIDFRHQILTSKVDPRAVRVNPYPAEFFASIFIIIK